MIHLKLFQFISIIWRWRVRTVGSTKYTVVSHINLQKLKSDYYYSFIIPSLSALT